MATAAARWSWTATARPILPGDYVLVGLVDFGNGCAQPGYPGVYTRIGDPEVASFLISGVDHKAKLAGRQSRKKRRATAAATEPALRRHGAAALRD